MTCPIVEHSDDHVPDHGASRVDRAIELGVERGSMDMVQYAAVPLVAALAIALVLSFAMRETYPAPDKKT